MQDEGLKVQRDGGRGGHLCASRAAIWENLLRESGGLGGKRARRPEKERGEVKDKEASLGIPETCLRSIRDRNFEGNLEACRIKTSKNLP